MFCHEKLKVYQYSVQFLGAIVIVIRAIPAGNADVVSQLRRAAMSISLNIAEGAGKTGENDKRRFYSIARGSALECAAIILEKAVGKYFLPQRYAEKLIFLIPYPAFLWAPCGSKLLTSRVSHAILDFAVNSKE